jgi:hypothetical protein
MELKYASIENLKDGWVLSYDLLTSIQETMKKNPLLSEEVPSLEQIEGVLIAFKLYSNG